MQFDGEYSIHASDIRKDVIESAKRSAKFAGFKDGEIEFSCEGYDEALRKMQAHKPHHNSSPQGEDETSKLQPHFSSKEKIV